jgi:predicted glycosyltransferase
VSGVHRQRILIFCAESRGLGHLKRLSGVARRLAEWHSVLFITSERLGGDFLVPPVEYIRLPPLHTSHASSAGQWDRATFLAGGLDGVLQLRTELLRQTFKIYCPHAMITDMFALGRGCELLPHLKESGESCLNYLILRGVLGDERYTRTRVFSPQAVLVLRRHYKRLLVACDRRVFNAAEYGLPSDITAKTENVGYVINQGGLGIRDSVRRSRSVGPEQIWVVCAAGGGLSSEHLLERCLQVALQKSNCRFTIVLGPHSRLALDRSVHLPAHVEIVSHELNLSNLFASCDIAVIHGGYNSLLESACSGVSVLVVPNDGEEEQEKHAGRLSSIADVRVSSLDKLDSDIEQVLRKKAASTARPIPILDTGGADKVCSLIRGDLLNRSIEEGQVQ